MREFSGIRATGHEVLLQQEESRALEWLEHLVMRDPLRQLVSGTLRLEAKFIWKVETIGR